MFPWTHVASRHDSVSSGADHGLPHHEPPPVGLGAVGVVDHGQQGLLQVVSDGTSSCEEPSQVVSIGGKR